MCVWVEGRWHDEKGKDGEGREERRKRTVEVEGRVEVMKAQTGRVQTQDCLQLWLLGEKEAVQKRRIQKREEELGARAGGRRKALH